MSDDKEENIKVVLRVRPLVDSGDNDNNTVKCLHHENDTAVRVDSHSKIFNFDQVLHECISQEKVFESVGRGVIETCIEGYNGTIFAYGQTGSGKTFTMMGKTDENSELQFEERGIIPRAFEYLFILMEREKNKGTGASFSCSCSFTEIYNERIYDLMDPTCTGKNLREDVHTGVHIEDVSEHIVESPQEALEVLNAGNSNRRTAETSMNRESSRSHAIFTMTIKSIASTGDGISNVKVARLNLIDLAGSERQRDTQADGTRLREAGQINKSLSTLGNVITALVDITKGKQRHIPYRDSKLTFLLRDSLGGNTKTFLLAAVNPSRKAFSETLSTLKFAQRAKLIKNKAACNEDFVGNVKELQAEVKRLRDVLSNSQGTITSLPAGLCQVLGNEEDLSVKKLLSMVIDLHKKAENEKIEVTQRLFESQDLITEYQRHLQIANMRYKFREAEVQQLKRGKSSLSESEQIASLKQEINVLEQQLKVNVDAARLLTKNKSLQAELDSLRSQYQISEDNASLVETRTRMLEMEEIVRQLLSENKDKIALGNLMTTPVSSPSMPSPRLRQMDSAHVARVTRNEKELKQQIAVLQHDLDEARQHTNKVQEIANVKICELEATKQAAERAASELERALETERLKAKAREARARDEQFRELTIALGDLHESDEIVDIQTLRSRMEILVRDLKEAHISHTELSNKVVLLETSARQARQEIDQLNSQLKIQQEKKAVEYDNLLKTKQEAFNTLSEENKVKQTQLSQFERKVSELDRENIAQAGQIVSIKQELNSLAASNQELLDGRDAIESELNFYTVECTNLQQELESIKSRLKETQTENEALQNNVIKLQDAAVAVQEQLRQENETQAQVMQLSQKKTELTEELLITVASLEESNYELSKRDQEIKDLSDRYERKEKKWLEERNTLLSEIRKSNDQVKELESSNHALSTELADYREESERLTLEIASMNSQKDELERMLEHTESMIATTENEFKDQLEELSDAVEKSRQKTKSIEKENEELHEQLCYLQTEKTSLMEQHESSIIQVKLELKKAQETIKQLHDAAASRDDTTSVEKELAEAKRDLKQMREQEDRLLEMLEAAEATRIQKNEEIMKLRQELEEVKQKVTESSTVLSEVENLRKQNCELETALQTANSKTNSYVMLQKEVKGLRENLAVKEKHLERREQEVKEQAHELSEALVCAQALNKDLFGMKDSLDRARTENISLRKDNSILRKENKALVEERDGLIGHQNPRQKLKHMAKIRAENNDLRTRLNDMSKQLATMKHFSGDIDQENIPTNIAEC